MNWKKINLYLLLSFAISWISLYIMNLAGIEYGSLPSIIVLAVFYMGSPALATFIIQKYIYKEGFKIYGWTFEKKYLKQTLLTIVYFLLLFGFTMLFILALGNTSIIPEFGQFSFSQDVFDTNLRILIEEKSGMDLSDADLPSMPANILFFAIMLQAIIAGCTVNLPFMFGEEFGWRGLLLKETQSMGFLKANLFIGFVWGVWHAPIIFLGHNYPNYPYFGILMMCFFTISLSPLFAYVRLKTQSILAPSMLHGMINASAGLFILYVTDANELYGSLAGWAGVFSGVFITIMIFLFDKDFVKNYRTL